MTTAAAHAAALWAALNLILMLALSVRVVRLRRGLRIGVGYGDSRELELAARAFGNASEYVPAALMILLLLAVLDAPPSLVHGLGFIFTAGRIAHAIGLSRSAGATIPRAVGVLATWLVYLTGAVILLVYAIP